MTDLITLKRELSARRDGRSIDAADALLAAYEALAAAEARIVDQQKKLLEMEAVASTDCLTGLMNRRGFEKFYAQEKERLRRRDSQGSLLVLIDLDHFKEINDIHGHLAGDVCLKMVANHLQSSIRIVDGAARFGGDEFAILLTQTDPQAARDRVKRMKRTLDNMVIDWQGRKLRVGASIGVKEIYPDSDYETAYQAADTALYGDKSLRRQLQKAVSDRPVFMPHSAAFA